MHSHWGFVFCVLCFRGEICTGTEREGGRGGRGREFRGMMDGGKYERERNQWRVLILSVFFFFLSPSSRVYQLIATYNCMLVLSRLS